MSLISQHDRKLSLFFFLNLLKLKGCLENRAQLFECSRLATANQTEPFVFTLTRKLIQLMTRRAKI